MKHCTLSPEIKILDEAKGLVEYVASDETVDHYREVIRADGWRFDFFKNNAPFLDSHQGGTIGCQIGEVVDFRVQGRRLIETVKWAIDVEENKLALFGFKMTQAGYLKAVSVGFFPVRAVQRWDGGFPAAIADLGLEKDSADRVQLVYIEQQQVELSACVIGANPEALVRAYKSGCVDDADVDFASGIIAARQLSAKQTPSPASAAPNDAAAKEALEQRHREEFLRKFSETISKL